MKAPKSPTTAKAKVLATLDYLPTASLQTSYLTGLFATPTPEGSINVVGYVERKGFPEQAELIESPDGDGVIMEDIGKMGWVREIHSSFLLSITTAKDLIDVLQQAIEVAEERQKRKSNDKK